MEMDGMINNSPLLDHYLHLFEDQEKSQNGEIPAFLKNIRRKALEQLLQLGLPDRKQEQYKYTDINALFSRGFKPILSPVSTAFDIEHVFKCDVPTLDTHLFFLLNGFYFNQGSPLNGMPEGILVGSIQDALRTHPELLEAHLNQYITASNEGLVALNTALSQDGIFIFVPRNTIVDKPIQVVNLIHSDSELFVQHRNLIVLEENAQLDLVVCDHVISPFQSLTNSVTEIVAAPDARLDYTKLQNEHDDSATISSLFISQDTDSRVHTNIFSLHGGLIRNNHYVAMRGSGSENNANGLYLTDRHQHIDNFVKVEHRVPHCMSNQLYKGVLDESATGAFNGFIHVFEDAQKTQAYQRNNNILLTDEAKMNARPQLEIYADDVKCSHGATVGQLDEEALFYIKSRGIPHHEARLMLMFGFAHEVIQNLAIDPLRHRIDDLVNKRLRGELSRCDNCEIHCR
jgi:Fe-S cluster assembly protein SufD